MKPYTAVRRGRWGNSLTCLKQWRHKLTSRSKSGMKEERIENYTTEKNKVGTYLRNESMSKAVPEGMVEGREEVGRKTAHAIIQKIMQNVNWKNYVDMKRAEAIVRMPHSTNRRRSFQFSHF